MNERHCSNCGGRIPNCADELDAYLTRPEDGHCPGHITTDDVGKYLGCGAWNQDAYDCEESA